MIKKILVSAGMFFALSGVAFAAGNKVSVCHVTGSVTNPMILVSVSSNAVAAHLGHGDFLLPSGAAICSDDGGGGPASQ
ncbi:MAG: hypothetical protein Q7R54_02240 [bacterium]|nr:hypothetical protein [bacterium]